jgi:ABC-type glycerol-3-phosphate transport system substrate-binding protein
MTSTDRSPVLNRRRLLSAAAGSSLAVAWGRSFAQASTTPVIFSRTPAYQDGTTITAVVPTFVGAGDAFMRAQAEEFATETGIQVDLQFLKFEEAMNRQTTVVAARSGEIDVFGTHYAQIGKFGESMVPLNDLAAESEITPDDYVSGSFDALTVNGKLLAIPFTFDVRALYYRTDLFEAAGIADPPTNWENFLETAQALNQPPDVYGFMMVGRGDPALREYSDRLWENGGDFLEMGLEPSRPTWNEPAGVEALEFMRDLIWEYEVAPPGTPSYGWEENSQLFAAGQAAMSKQWDPSAMQDPAQSVIIDKYSIAPLTENKTSRTTVVCHARGINLYSEKQDAAWEYVKYVTSADQLYMMHEAARNRPAQVLALQQAIDSAEGIIKQGLEISLKEAENGYTWPLFAQFAEVQPILWGEIEKVLSNQISAQEGLDYAAEQAIQVFERDGLI